ncbi:MAG: threonine ammonia-lyase [Candidatus Rokuibacteriota bacterium]
MSLVVTRVPELADIEAARRRIGAHVRRTPLLRAAPVSQPAGPGELWLKLECLQVIGSFKARGAVSKLTTLPSAALARGIVTASGGNHGLGVAYAGWLARVPATVYLPSSTPPAKMRKLEAWGARVVVEGAVWDDANQAALAAAERDGLTYFHPFADPAVIAGQGTLGLEILEDLPMVGTLVVAIGGGGLISGISLAVKTVRPETRIVGVEPVGAPTLSESLRAGRLVELDAIRTAATTLAPRRSEAINLEIISRLVDEIVLVSDDDMRAAARWLWHELGVAAELSSAAAVAALRAGRVTPRHDEPVCALVCGAGTDGLGD